MYVYVCEHAYVHVCVCLCVNVRTCMCVYVRTRMCWHMHVDAELNSYLSYHHSVMTQHTNPELISVKPIR